MYEVFQKLLNDKNVTAYKVAKDIGLNNSMFSEWKKGTYRPKVDKLQKIATYFGVSLDYLVNGQEASDEN